MTDKSTNPVEGTKLEILATDIFNEIGIGADGPQAIGQILNLLELHMETVERPPAPPEPQSFIQVFNRDVQPCTFISRQTGPSSIPSMQGLTVAGQIQVGHSGLDFDAFGHDSATGKIITEQVSLPYRAGLSLSSVIQPAPSNPNATPAPTPPTDV